MTETFYIKVSVTSNEKLEFYEDRKDGEEVEIPADPKTNNRFNKLAEKAIKKVLMENVDMLGEILDDDEGIGIEKHAALESIVSQFYDVEADPTAITEDMSPGIKFTVVKKI